MTKRSVQWVWVLAASLVAHTSSVRADLISYTTVANNGGANYASGTGGFFDLPQFDSSLGSLQSVVITVTGLSLGGHVWVDNEWSAGGKIQLQLGVNIVLTTPDFMEMYLSPMQSTSLTTLGADSDGESDFAGTDSFQLNGTSASTEQSDHPVNLDSFIGGGLMTYSFWGEGFQLSMPLSPLDVAGRVDEDTSLPSYGLSAQISYEYLARGDGDGNIPEPGTLGMGLVLGGYSLSLWGRRKWREHRSRCAEAEGERRAFRPGSGKGARRE